MRTTRALLMFAVTALLVGCAAQKTAAPTPESSTSSSTVVPPPPTESADSDGELLEAQSLDEKAFSVFARVYELALIATDASGPEDLTVEAMESVVD